MLQWTPHNDTIYVEQYVIMYNTSCMDTVTSGEEMVSGSATTTVLNISMIPQQIRVTIMGRNAVGNGCKTTVNISDTGIYTECLS